MNRLIFSFICCLISFTLLAQRPIGLDDQVRKIAFTFDDGDTASYKGFPLNQWNNQILQALDKHQLKAIFYVHGKNKFGSVYIGDGLKNLQLQFMIQ
jgi:peptidoglycan/xylan/chitin deacetylase (PgdA/CDA1 family)